jgi:hypothetical protein
MGLDYTVPVAVQVLKSVLYVLYDIFLLRGISHWSCVDWVIQDVQFAIQLLESVLYVLCDLSLYLGLCRWGWTTLYQSLSSS